MITVVEAKTKKQMKAFATFPIKLYRHCKYYVPNFVSDEANLLDPEKNLSYGNCTAKCFLAYDGKKLVGRICGIISPSANEKNNEKVVRFSRPDFVENIEVLQALLRAVGDWGKSLGMEIISGPWGFNDTDREGLLTYGYNQLSNYATAYSYSYYAHFFDLLGFKKESEWIEYAFDYNNVDPRFEKLAKQIRETGEYRDLCETMSVKEVVTKYQDSFFDCYNKAYANLDNFVKIEGKVQQSVIQTFTTVMNIKYFSCIVNKENKVVAFGVGLPHLGNSIRWGKGRMLLSAIPLLFTIKFPKRIELALIGVDPAYTNYGLHALVVDRFVKNFKKNKIKDVWMDPVLTTNLKMQQTWKWSAKSIRQTRQTYRLPISQL